MLTALSRQLYTLSYQGELKQAEDLAFASIRKLFDELFEAILPLAAESFSEQYDAPKGSGAQIRPHKVRLSSGQQIPIESPYLRQSGEASTRPITQHWKLAGSYSLALMDKVAYMGVMSGSYNLASEALKKFGVSCSISSVRDITNAFAAQCEQVGEANLLLASGETLADKRVVISVDGGRSRIRELPKKPNKDNPKGYDTPWKEPKLFVIDVLDEEGQASRYELPLYGCRFDPQAMLDLLKGYLKQLHIEQAEQVQFIADGASWIWNRVPSLLASLGVKAERIEYTLDYYHAMQYLHSLISSLPRRVNQATRQGLLKQAKALVWKGKVTKAIRLIKKHLQRMNAEQRRWLNYLIKHSSRMQYADLQHRKLLCGSGLMESAVRRVINLRFKSAGTFWSSECLEKLFFLRGAALSKRWDTLLTNLQKGVA